MNLPGRRIEVCLEQDLRERDFRVVPLLYRHRQNTGIVFRLHDQVHAYLNQCVHMPRRLNCERDTIFSDDGAFLRCSMHGIVYDPVSGASISTMCHGEQLHRIRLTFSNDRIYIDDKRVRPNPDNEAG